MAGECVQSEDLLDQYRRFAAELAGLNRPGRFDARRDLGLERIACLLELLGNPQQAFPIMHVAGTAGKGSTSATVAAILATAGYTTGLHLSPALQILNEGFQINGRMVSIARLAGLLATIRPAIAQMQQSCPAGPPTSFEVQVALALCLFQQEGVDVAVVETGLGGAHDATSIVPATVAVLTSIGLDHTEVFGDTIAAVAQAEAGIIKPGQHVISGVHQLEAQQVIARRCRELDATLWQSGHDFSVIEQESSFTLSTPNGLLVGLQTGMTGEFQHANAACAVAAVQALPGFAVPQAAVRHGLQQAYLPGRMECVQEHPAVVLDGAHSPDKLRAMRRAMYAAYGNRRWVVLFALKSDKDVFACLEQVGAGRWTVDGGLGGDWSVAPLDLLIVTRFYDRGLWQAHDPDLLARVARERLAHLAVQVVADPLKGLDLALAVARPQDVILVTGSLYLVGDVRERWYPAAELLRQAEKPGV